ncbi:MAG: hypothetical protein AB8B82_08755 [Roseovarius sp.]
MPELVKYAAGGLALLALTACEGTPLRDAYALSQVDPMTTEARALRVAVAVPRSIQLMPGGVQMLGRVMPPDGEDDMYTFNLAPVLRMAGNTSKDTKALDALVRHEYQIDPDSLAEFEAFRAAAQANKATGGQGSLTVNADLCHEDAAPPDPLPITVYLKTAELDRFAILTQRDNLRDDLSDADLSTLTPPCG